MFKLKTLWKDNFRGISSSFGRFLSIILIVLLGVSIFAGITAAGSDMLKTAQIDFDKQNLSDQTIMSTVGLNNEDLDIIKSMKGAHVEAQYTQDAIIEDTSTAVRIYGYNAKHKINQYRLEEGRLPEEKNEIAIDKIDTLTSDFKIGDELTLADDDLNLSETSFKVVGIVSAPQYIDNTSRGMTTVGSGRLSGFVVVPEATFTLDNPTMANVTYDETANLEAYSTAYEDTMDNKSTDLEKKLDEQADKREKELKDEITDKITDGEAEINDARTELADAETQLDQTRQQLETAGLLDVPEETLPAEAAAQVEAFHQAESDFAEEKDNAESEIADAESELADARETEQNLEVEFMLQNRDDYPGYSDYQVNADRINAIARVFPVFFFLVALLVTLTTMTRMVDEDRGHMGILKSLGYSNGQLALKYLTYAGMAGLIGAVLGLVIGYWLFPTVVIQAYSSMYEFSSIHTQWYPWITAISLIAAFLATVGATLYALWPSLRAMPAGLLTEPAPKKGKKILLERWNWLWQKLSFNYKIAFRNIFRYKKRMWMTIIGVAGCVALMLLGYGVSDSVNDILDGQYSDYVRYNGMISLDTADDDFSNSAYQTLVDDTDIITASKDYYSETDTTETSQAGDADVSIIALDSDAMTDMSDFRGLYDADSGKEITTLPKDGVMITQKMAELKDLQVGDEITVENNDGDNYTFKVAEIYKNYVGHEIMMSKDVYADVIGEPGDNNSSWINFDPTEENEKAIEKAFIDEPYVQAVAMVSTIENAFSSTLDSLNLVVVILIIAAALLAIVVLYNLTNVNVAERRKELATLKVLGFHDRELTLYIYRENIFLTLFGILLGYVLGILLHAYIIYTVEFNDVMFGRMIHFGSYVYATLLTLLFSFIVLLVIHFKLKKTDMLEALDEE